MKYAWFTVGLPEWTPERTVKELRKAGYDGAEWRVVKDDGDMAKPSFWKGNRCTLQEDWPLSKFKEVARMTAEEGLSVPNLGSYCLAAERDRVERMMEVARIFSAPSLRVGICWWDGKADSRPLWDKGLSDYAKVADLAGRYGLRALLEIHMNTLAPSASAAFRFVSHFPVSRVGVIHDAGNMEYEGFENYRLGLETLGDYLAHVHVKNSEPFSEKDPDLNRLKWGVRASPLREGSADFPAFFSALKTRNYDGWLSIEDFSLKAAQEEKVVDNIRFLKEIETKVS